MKAWVWAGISALALGACGGGPTTQSAVPETALRAFVDAMIYGDHEVVWAALEPDFREDLQVQWEQEVARYGRDVVGHHPAALLLPVWLPRETQLRVTERVDRSGDHVALRLETVFGREHRVDMRRGAEGWVFTLTWASGAEGSDG